MTHYDQMVIGCANSLKHIIVTAASKLRILSFPFFQNHLKNIYQVQKYIYEMMVQIMESLNMAIGALQAAVSLQH